MNRTRQRLSHAEEREMVGGKDAGEPHPSLQTGGQADGAELGAGQCRNGVDPRRSGTCLCAQKNRFGLFISTISIARAGATGQSQATMPLRLLMWRYFPNLSRTRMWHAPAADELQGRSQVKSHYC